MESILNKIELAMPDAAQKITPKQTNCKEINDAIANVMRVFLRSLLAAARKGEKHPSFNDYAAALSPDFAHKSLMMARHFGLFPKYSESKAEKFGIDWGCSFTNQNGCRYSPSHKKPVHKGQYREIFGTLDRSMKFILTECLEHEQSLEEILLGNISGYMPDWSESKVKDACQKYLQVITSQIPQKHGI